MQDLEAACRWEYEILIPQNAEWSECIESCFPGRVRRITRYAIRKEPDIFDRGLLERAADSFVSKKKMLKEPAMFPLREQHQEPEYRLRSIDRELYELCRREEWSRDLVSRFPDYETYERLGLGIAVLKGNELASGASSYARYRGGIEIEIDTKPEYRRHGLAFACGAALLSKCLNRGLYPSWDAHSRESVALAEKLGYHFSHAYPAYEITRPACEISGLDK